MKENNKSFTFQSLISDYLLILFFIIFSVSIFLKSYYNPDGYLSPDSTNYLRLAQNLLEGKGFEVGAYYHINNSREYFAIWPVGYPFFIFIVAKITGLSVFWASKLLNILNIGLLLIGFRLLFKNKAWIYALILFMAGFQHIYTFTWSESPFILVLFWFTIILYRFIKNKDIKFGLSFSLMFLSLLLFLLRYIGFFSFIVLGFIGLLFLFKDKRKFFILSGISLINIVLSELYLYNNYLKTNFLTGAEKTLDTSTAYDKILMIAKGIIQEFLLPVTHLTPKTAIILLLEILSLLYIFFISNKKKIFTKFKTDYDKSIFVYTFLFVGISYELALIFLRWIFYFDDLDYRLLGPGTFLIWIAIIFMITNYFSNKTQKTFIGLFVFFILISFSYNTLYFLYLDISKNKPYNKNIVKLKQKYDSLPHGAALIFGSKHMIYLRTDIIDIQLYHFKKNENWTDFINRLSKFKNIYLEIPEDKKTIDEIKQLKPDVFSFINKNKKGEIIKLK